ncbi:hypothetical protein C7S14_7142 [Burkholderia cepacia]|nr:hypothetical protein C7S14_7142 [Burkholderia cepacia]
MNRTLHILSCVSKAWSARGPGSARTAPRTHSWGDASPDQGNPSARRVV